MDMKTKPFCVLLKKFLFLFGLPGFFLDSVDHLKEEKKKKGQHINIRQVKTGKWRQNAKNIEDDIIVWVSESSHTWYSIPPLDIPDT